MASGTDFLGALKAAIAPATIIQKTSGRSPDHILVSLSDGRTYVVNRQRAKANPEAYVAELLA